MVGRSRALLVVILFACDSHETTFEAGAPDPDATTSDASSSCPFCFDASYDVSAPTPPDALPPPEVDCVLDAGPDATICPLPHSICADTQWLEYFDNGFCDDGGCLFDSKLLLCGLGCYEGGCVVQHSTDPAP
jgi:hypothetical protein